MSCRKFFNPVEPASGCFWQMRSNVMITVDNLVRKYDDFTAVDGVSFTISPGEIVGLLGHNGAGKTTIMKMLAGYLEPTFGTVSVGGRDVVSRRTAVQRQVGYLPENCPVYPEMTVVSYLEYAAALRGIEKDRRPERVRAAIARTALADKADQSIATLSRGYRQRAGVAQAILVDPAILILDEPTNGLDPTQIQHMRDLIRELSASATVLISTHILQEVQAVCDRVIIISHGRKVLDSKIDALQNQARLIVALDGRKAEAELLLQSLAGIDRVEKLGPDAGGGNSTRYALKLSPAAGRDETAADVARAVHDKGWPLYSLSYESRDLERIFAQASAK